MFKRLLATILSAMLVWIVFSVYVFFRPIVDESTKGLSKSETPAELTLRGSFPVSAQDIHFATASVGMAGRFLAYRLSGTLEDLHEHATAEFASHWESLAPTAEKRDAPPFDASSLEFWQNGFNVKLDWLDLDEIGRGVVYIDEHGSSRPIIYVDEENSVLYFTMTD